MIERTEERFGLKPERLAADTAHGAAPMLNWLVEEKDIAQGRELQGLGHTVRLMRPSYVKAYLKRGKNDANDAAAICEAVTRPSMQLFPIKTNEQQTALMLYRARPLLVRQRTMLTQADKAARRAPIFYEATQTKISLRCSCRRNSGHQRVVNVALRSRLTYAPHCEVFQASR
jgi:hypothetical protein